MSTFVVSITPFDGDGRLDEPGLRGHLQRMRAAGVGVYLGGSGSGEGYTLSDDEMHRLLAIGVEELSGAVPVRAMGVEPRSAAAMIELGHAVERTGADAMQLYSLDLGHGNRPTPAEVERYLRTVLDAVPAPIVLSTHQSVGYFVAPDLLAALVGEYDQIIGINCSTTDVTYLARVVDAADGRVDVHAGGPMHALTCLALGGQGFLSSDANLAPRLCASVIAHFAAGELAACAAAYRVLMQLHTETRALGGIVATKAALDLLGLPGGGPPRPPRLPLDDAGRARVQRRIVDALDLRSLEQLP